jgi:hypothetical protein
VFRYWSYKKWVFIGPAGGPDEPSSRELAGAGNLTPDG